MEHKIKILVSHWVAVVVIALEEASISVQEFDVVHQWVIIQTEAMILALYFLISDVSEHPMWQQHQP